MVWPEASLGLYGHFQRSMLCSSWTQEEDLFGLTRDLLLPIGAGSNFSRSKGSKEVQACFESNRGITGGNVTVLGQTRPTKHSEQVKSNVSRMSMM